jgi:hypothetical protein
MKKTVMLLLLIPIIFSYCTKIDKNGIAIVNVDAANNDSLPLSTIATSIDYIPLETTKEALLGRYGGPRFFKQGILISSENGIYCFDLKGKYRFKIFRIGKGPGEYQQISAYLIDETQQRIEIMDQRSRKLLKFKLGDGSFIEEQNSILFAQNMDLLNDASYIFYTMGDGSTIPGGSPDWDYKVIITDRSGLTIKRKYFPGECSLYGQYPFIKTDQSFKVHLPYNDTLYEVRKDTIVPALFVDFAGYGLPKGFSNLSLDEQKQYDKSTMAYLMNAYESENYYLFMWGYKNRVRWHLWSKEKQKGLNFKWLYDDLDGLNQYISFKRWESGTLVAMFNSVDITTQQNIEKEKIYQKLIEKGWVPDENSNPIIALYNIGF